MRQLNQMIFKAHFLTFALCLCDVDFLSTDNTALLALT